MKTFSHLYDKVTQIEHLFQAWEEFKKGKRKKSEIGYFERYLEDNIFQLHQELVSRTYKHSSYTGFYVRDPKVRHIHKAVVRDRIVHHAIYKVVNPIFEPTFISDSYSCRKGFGTHKGFKKLVEYNREVSQNYTQGCWALKCDIKKFFDSVDHNILLNILKEKIKDPYLIWLLEEIIRSFGEGNGVPIGSLTSQLFANVYLNKLDHFVKQGLRIKYYLRYADDFVFLSRNRNFLLQLIPKLRSFLENEMNVNLHPNKITLRKLSWGIDFVGYVALPHYQVVRTKTKKRIFRKVQSKIKYCKLGNIEEESLNQSIQSYLGILQYAHAYNLEQELKNKIWFWLL